MPAGLPYFAWIEASETTFGSEHLRWDEQVFSFTLTQEEGDPASLTIVVRRPRNEAGDPIGLLGPGRKIWCWFALDCGPALIKFRGRLVGIPTSIFEELVTLEFVAKPADMVAQKETLADTLRVLPYYDEAVIDEARRTDPDVVLEGYTAIWHYDRESHVVSISDEVSGEDGLVEFLCANGDVLYDGLTLNLTSGPLTRVDVAAEYTWTQQAQGTVDLTSYLTSHWPDVVDGRIQSYSLTGQDWPKIGATIGDGWVVANSSATPAGAGPQVTTTSRSSTGVIEAYLEDTATTTISETISATSSGGVMVGQTNVKDEVVVIHDATPRGRPYVSHFSRQVSYTNALMVVHSILPLLVAGYNAERQYTERVSFSLYADVQPILTDPEDGEALRIDDVRSVNLSDPINGNMPIGDLRRRSYIATERGNQSLEHLIALARAHLMKRARVVEIGFAPKLARMPEITLRKNAFLAEPRIGEATGKIIAYSIALDGSDGRINCEVRIGCTIGHGGAVAAADGDPTYCTVDYTGADYQVFINSTILFPLDTSVGYSPPIADPNDDGIDFLSALRAEDVIERDLVVVFGKAAQEEAIFSQSQWPSAAVGAASSSLAPSSFVTIINNPRPSDSNAEEMAQQAYYENLIKSTETKATFKLKPVTGREFTTDYEVQMTDLKIPTGYDLEAT